MVKDDVLVVKGWPPFSRTKRVTVFTCLRDESLADVRRVEFVDAPSAAALAAATADVDLTHLTFRSRLGLQVEQRAWCVRIGCLNH